MLSQHKKISIGTQVSKKIYLGYYMVSYQRTLYPHIVTMKMAKRFMVVWVGVVQHCAKFLIAHAHIKESGEEGAY